MQKQVFVTHKTISFHYPTMTSTIEPTRDIDDLVHSIDWLGHDGFFITGSKKIVIDPYDIGSFSKKADVVLISHEHRDHCSPKDIEKVSGKETRIVASVQAVKALTGNVQVLHPDESLEVEGLQITGIPAYNTNKFRSQGVPFHPKEDQKLGFVFEMDDIRYYFAGDTDFIPEMKKIKKIHVAFLPISGTYVMTVDEAVKAARTINPRLVIPMHFGSIVGTKQDAVSFAEKAGIAVHIPEKEI